MPVTTPADTVAAAPLLVHIPPVMLSLKEVVAPMHTVVVPVMIAGTGAVLTASVKVAVLPDNT